MDCVDGLTMSVDQGPSREANSGPHIYEIPRFLWNPLHYHDNNSFITDSTLEPDESSQDPHKFSPWDPF